MFGQLGQLGRLGQLGGASTVGLTKAALIARLTTLGAVACYLPSEYATTAWQRYDATMARAAVGYAVGFLGDVMQNMSLGSEMLSNGDFSNGTTGWVLQNGTWSVTSGVLAITSVSGFSAAFQKKASSSGKFYRMASTLVNGTGVARRRGSSGTVWPIFTTPENFYRSTGTELWFYCETGGGAGLTSYFDNCSLAEVQGNHSSCEPESNRPTLRYAGGLYYIGPTSGQGLTAYLPASVGSTCTVIYANPGVGAVIVTGVAVTSQSLPLPYKHSGLVIMPSTASAEAVAAVAAMVDVLARRTVV